LAGALALVLAGATAGAADQCFEDNSGNLYVAKALTLPGANGCKPFNGYISEVASAVAGNVCKTSNNAFFYFNLHVSNGTLDAYFVAFNLNATTLTGNGRTLHPGFFGTPGTFTAFSIDKVPCPADRFFGF
jgi:hypothetical protein